MKYNFDEVIDRTKYNSVKWCVLEENYGDKDLLPMWIADMDFKSANEIQEALVKRAENGVYGYGAIPDSFYESIINWAKKRYDWEIKKEWIIFTPGVIVGFNIGVREFSKEGDKVLVQPPVYPPFFRVLENNNRILNESPLVFNGEKFVMDLKDVEEKIDKDTKVLMLCNPHNPVGRVWTKEELEALGKLCLDNNIVIVSDEIHCDLTFKDNKHIPIASISPELAMNTITLMSPSKAFNVAGLFTSFAIIPNDEMRNTFTKAIEIMEIGHATTFGTVGLEAAYTHGEQWLDEVLEYIEANVDYAIDYIEKNIPEIKVTKPEGTYLLWLDFRELNLPQDRINEILIKEGKLALNDGVPYGTGGEGYFRINVGCPRVILEEGLCRLEKAIASIR